MIKVSVVVPVYNAGSYLEKCMDSICGQTLRDIEIICIDDGSTDRSYQILKRYADNDRRIKILCQKNQYAGAARNHGMLYATGEYLSFLDADDYFEPDMLEKMYQKAKQRQADIVVCRYLQLSEKSGRKWIPEWDFIDSFLWDKELFSGESLPSAGIFQIVRGWAWDKLFRTDFVKKCGYTFSDFRSSEDGCFVYMLMASAKRISYMDDIFVVHRTDQDGSLSNTKESNWMNGFKMLSAIREELIKKDIYAIYQKSFLNEVNNFMFWYLESLHSLDAYKNCYSYIQEYLEPVIGVLEHDRDYYSQKEEYDWYRYVCRHSFEEYMFSVREKLLGILDKQKETMCVQEKIIKEAQERDWVFPYRRIEKGKILILYGAGNVGRAYYKQLTESGFCGEVIWADRQYDKYRAMGLDVQSPDIIFQRGFDYIFIAIRDTEIREEIKEWLLEQGIQRKKIKGFG